MVTILSQRDQMRLQRAMQNSPENRRREELRNRLESIRRHEEEARQRETDAFRNWELTDRFRQQLEEIRDANRPTKPSDDLSPLYHLASMILPGVRDDAREFWLEYSAMKHEGR